VTGATALPSSAWSALPRCWLWNGRARGVTANTISPTVVLPPLAKEPWDNLEGEAPKAEIPSQGFAEPQEIAVVAVFLASDAAKMINGESTCWSTAATPCVDQVTVGRSQDQ
jgi:NAD(P)-dependent dehydrogenase (short-subunit alcohol dehydrogenase family)